MKTTIRALEATERKADEFARERQLLDAKLELLQRIASSSPVVDEFVARLESLAAEHHMQIEEWLWPYTAKVRIARAEVDRLCSERAEHAATLARMDDFTVKKSRLEELVSAIERAQSERRPPEIVFEPEPTATVGPARRKKA